ncbi:MAG: universal stress protein [bacterium]|nr:universal stress protein [bacterium]
MASILDIDLKHTNSRFHAVPTPHMPSHSVVVQRKPARIGIVLDGTGKSERALPRAIELAREHQATLVLIHVCKSSTDASAGAEKWEEAQRYVVSHCNKLIRQKLSVKGSYVTRLSAAADAFEASAVDLIVVAEAPRTWSEKLFRPSPSVTLQLRTDIPVVTVSA